MRGAVHTPWGIVVTMSRPDPSPAVVAPTPVIGELVDGIDIPVVNERAVRAAAGLLFLGGFATWMIALTTGELQPLRTFGAVFLIDMNLRLFVGTRAAPSLIVGTSLTRAQRPEWVDARSKLPAWYLGLGMALLSCLALGLLGLPAALTLTLCGLCLALLFAEAALGVCIGCELARRFARVKPVLCAGDTCNYTPPRRGERHRVG